LIRALEAAHIPIELSSYDPEAPKCISSTLKAIVIAACSLAVDVTGDFDSPCTYSAVAWARFFSVELTGGNEYLFNDHSEQKVSENCNNLMRMKLIICRALNWNLAIYTHADYFTQCTKTLGDQSIHLCGVCNDIRYSQSQFMQQSQSLLDILGQLFLPRHLSCEEIAQICFACMHDTWMVHIPTPLSSGKDIHPSIRVKLWLSQVPIVTVCRFVQSLAPITEIKKLVRDIYDYLPNSTSRMSSEPLLELIEESYYNDDTSGHASDDVDPPVY